MDFNRKDSMTTEKEPTRRTIADTLFLGGDIITVHEANPTSEALAVKGGKILAVGKYAEELCPDYHWKALS
jgi:hypothetical protein